MKKRKIINPDPDFQNNLMAFGFDCGKGWHPLIEETLDLIEQQDLPDYFEITQIKEKFGELLIYCNVYFDAIEDIIESATKKSITICEYCGKSAKLRLINDWWFTTLCDKCLQKRLQEDDTMTYEDVEGER